MKTLILGHSEVSNLLSMKECIGVMEEALKCLARGDAQVPLRSSLKLPRENGVLGLMPGFLGGNPSVIGVKAVCVFPGNSQTIYDSHQGIILLCDTQYGCPLAVMDAGSITAIRTAAVSAVATNYLAREGASRLAILGSGIQAEKHLEAMCLIRPINKVKVWSHPEEHGLRFVERMKNLYPFHLEFVSSSDEAVIDADIVCTVTSSPLPILKGSSLKKGTHINAVGACFSTSRELDTEAIAKARFFGDMRSSTFAESGDFLIPLKEGVISEDHFLGEIGDVLIGKTEWRRREDDITLFKSLGLAIEDLAAARFIYLKALAENLGSFFDLVGTRRQSTNSKNEG